MFVLQHLGIVDGDDMERILMIFNSLDQSNDGVLDLRDVRRTISSRAASRGRSGFLSGTLSGYFSGRLPSGRLSTHSEEVPAEAAAATEEAGNAA